MKKRWLMLTVVFVLVASGSLHAEGPSSATLMLADLDAGDKPNNIGGDFGAWDRDPDDETQSCEMSFEAEDALGDPLGYSIRLDYDVDSQNPAYNGFWMKLKAMDATPYDTLSFYVKGNEEAGFTKRVKIELKDQSNKASAYVFSGVTGAWQKVSIPFEKFRKVKDWSSLNEFVVVFDDVNSRPKTGTIYIDQVSFSKEV